MNIRFYFLLIIFVVAISIKCDVNCPKYQCENIKAQPCAKLTYSNEIPNLVVRPTCLSDKKSYCDRFSL